MSALVLLLSTMFVLGISMAALPVPLGSPSWSLRCSRHGAVKLGLASSAGGVVLLASSWVAPALAVAATTYFMSTAYEGRAGSARLEARRLDAVAAWIESVRDVLLAGEQPVSAIAASVASAHPSLRPA